MYPTFDHQTGKSYLKCHSCGYDDRKVKNDWMRVCKWGTGIDARKNCIPHVGMIRASFMRAGQDTRLTMWHLWESDGYSMTDWMLLMEEVVAISVLFLLGIMYLFYVKYPYNKNTDRRPEDWGWDNVYTNSTHFTRYRFDNANNRLKQGRVSWRMRRTANAHIARERSWSFWRGMVISCHWGIARKLRTGNEMSVRVSLRRLIYGFLRMKFNAFELYSAFS